MRIPIYRSESQRTNEAPGRSFSARMDARPFVEAALQKGAVTGALADAVGAYAEQRGKMIADAEYNQTALALEEEMRSASYDLSKSNDIGNIFDGKKLWQRRMDRIQTDVLDRVKNSNIKRKLGFTFNQSEIQSRFTLQGVVDQKIVKAQQAAIAARQTSEVAKMSQPGGDPKVRIAAYNAFIGYGNNPGVNGAMLAPGIAGGFISPGAVSKTNLAMKKDIATNYLSNAFGSDVNAMMQLAQFTNLLDDVGRSGTSPITFKDENNQTVKLSSDPAEAYTQLVNQMGIDPYAAHILSALPREDAFDVIDNNWKEAITRNDRIDAMEKTDKEALQERNEAAFNQAFTTDDYVKEAALVAVIGRPAVDDLLQDVGQNNLIVRPDADGKNEILALTVRETIYNYLNEQNWMSPEQRNKLRKLTQPSGGAVFAQTRNDDVYSKLYLDALSGNLTIEQLQSGVPYAPSIKSQITDEDFRALGKIIIDEAGTNVNEMSTLIKRNFRYNAAQQTIEGNDNLGKASKSAFEVVDLQLRMFAIDRKIEGNPPTLEELVVEKDRLISIQDTLFQTALREEYTQALELFVGRYAGLTPRITAVGGGDASISTVIQTIQQYFVDQQIETTSDEYLGAMRTIEAFRFTYPGMNE